ncbi:hypothetical protein EV182_003680 [Spiromyces aspiralis]|uniref:Uncharacterized protein n=1 Tax=Spiromyces aspiralis TaxID=68401 RepID=A0ACC1HCP4_9FUNG|nr:hypothetical protein EV182_003680 [Spiromyces aspiralis]
MLGVPGRGWLAKNAESEAPKSPVVEEPESTLGGVGTEPGQAAPTADGGPAVTIETPGETGREVPDLKRKAEDDGVGEEAEAAKSVKLENNGTPVKVIEDSTTDSDKVGVYIKNLVRPLMAQQVEELLGKYGACKEVWLNSIKSRCYAEFETPEQAKTAVENIDGTTFPEKTGRKVACGHLSKGKMHELVDLEERARSDGKTLDLIDKNGEVFLVCENGSKYCPDKPKNGGESEADEGSDSLANKDASNLSSVPIDSLYMKTKARPHLYYKPNSVGEKGEEAAATSPMHRSPGYDE